MGREGVFRPKISTIFVTRHGKVPDFLVFAMRRMGVAVLAGSMMMPLCACSRTSDGTIVADNPIALPSLDLTAAKPFVPSWIRKNPEPLPADVAVNFPPPPAKRTAPRPKLRPPLVTTSSGNLSCKNVSEGGRVRMVCQ